MQAEIELSKGSLPHRSGERKEVLVRESSILGSVTASREPALHPVSLDATQIQIKHVPND